jgi:hypothetical protein
MQPAQLSSIKDQCNGFEPKSRKNPAESWSSYHYWIHVFAKMQLLQKHYPKVEKVPEILNFTTYTKTANFKKPPRFFLSQGNTDSLTG